MSNEVAALPAGREWFTPEEIGRLVGRSAFRVREWCRLRRIAARKRATGRGKYLGWEICREAVLYYLNHGLLPIRQPTSDIAPEILLAGQ